MKRPTKFDVMRANRKTAQRAKRLETLRREAIELGMDEDSELAEAQAAVDEVREAKLRHRPSQPLCWWQHLIAFSLLRRSPS